MKRSVQRKVVVVLGYVALCTMLVLGGEPAAAPAGALAAARVQ
jgi:hypothetical protein